MESPRIKSIKARPILNSKGEKTIEVKLSTDLGTFFSSVPSGTSKGRHEAIELKGERAAESVNKIIRPVLLNKNPKKQKEIDNLLLKLDGTKNKQKLGANAILAVSLAVLRAGKGGENLPLFKYISQIVGIRSKLPKPSILLVEGGLHGKTKLDFQEFMVIPEGKSFRESFLKGKKIYENLKKILKNQFGQKGIQLGLEGAFTPPISEPRKVLDFIMEAAKDYKVKIGLDCAANNIKKGKYGIDFYKKLVLDYPVSFLEDPFSEEDWRGFSGLNKRIGKKISIIGDDLLTTNIERMKKARKVGSCNGVIIKPNQVGTVSETLSAVKLGKSFGWKIIVSHRSGETMDDFIADLAVGVGADLIKAGAPTEPERMVKYKRLLEIENKFFN